jgi:hypothetical protein
MLSPRLNDCPECADIPSLLKKIDCKLAELGNNLYNNISYMLNKPVPAVEILQLIGYRRILTYKYCNPNYVCKYSVKMIASRVIRLTLGCVSRCNEPERCLEEPCDIIIVPNPVRTTTTTSSTSTSTTSTTTTAVPTTTTTSSSSSTSTTTSTSSSTSTTTSTSSTSSTTTTSTTSNSTAGCPVGYYGPVGFPNRITGNGTMTLSSGLVVSTTYTGPAINSGFNPPFTNCVGGQFAGNVGDGGSISLNYNDGAFTFVITYSIPQTAVKFVVSGVGVSQQPGVSEYYTFTTNQSNTIVTELAGCDDFRVEAPNVVAGSYTSGQLSTGGNVEVVADAPFNTITITGNNPGSLNGTSFDMYICGIEPTSSTTTTSSSSTTTTSSSSTTSTTTTLAPSGFNTIYTTFEAL